MARTAEAIQLHLGHYVSGSAHVLLIGWVLFGGVFRSEPDSFEITGIEMISVKDFETLFDQTPVFEPDLTTEVAALPVPDTTETAPQIAPASDPAIDAVQTPEPTPVLPDPVPEISEPTPPTPFLPQPPEAPEAPSVEPPSAAPELAQRPVARPVRRVAPTAVEAPDPDLQISEVDQAPTAPSEEQTATEDAPEATAREEAATEIPTEPQAVAAAPTKSLRPRIRPRETTAAAQPTTPSTSNDSIAAALAEAEPAQPSRPSGPPLTFGEKEALRVSVQQCWNVDVGSQAANVVVTLGMSLDRDARVVGGSLRLLSAQGGDARAQNAAFEAARRAVLRCQRGGFDLPIEKYDHWRDIEMTFNPEKMRRR